MMTRNQLRTLGFALALTLTHGLTTVWANAETLPVKDVQRFTTAIGQIKNFYVEPVEDSKLFENAIRGMLNGLDPHSSYLDADEYEDLQINTSGEFGGLGIEVGMEEGFVKVISPIDDTPAHRAGVKAGDLIVKLDGTPIKGMSLREAVKKMRGKRGSKILLTIVREKEKRPLELGVVRDIIRVKSIKTKLLEGQYGYVRVSHFQAPSAAHMVTAIDGITKTAGGKLKGLVLDLRNNPGGLLDAAIEISDAFLHSKQLNHSKLIVFTKGRLPGTQLKALATPGDVLKGAPMVVLINEGSASGSEIVAGALQDHKRAVLMGTNSFGKGSVQTVLPLDDRRAIKLTTALYYTPKGRSIQAKGIIPDIQISQGTIPEKTNGEENPLLSQFVKEANLKGHLEGEKASRLAEETASKARIALARSDYQLFEALNMLKGLNVVKQ